MSTLKTNNIQHVDRSDPSIIISTDGGVSIAGTLTYEDVTNVDSVGIITAGKQLHVGTGVSIAAGGLNVTAGVSTFAGDVSIADKIVHTGDTNTAIRFSGADTIKLETSGTERFQVDSSGNIYVGGVGGSATAGSLWFNDTSANASKIVQSNGNSALTFHTGSSQPERLRIDSAGDVGINISDPTAKLHIVEATSIPAIKIKQGLNSNQNASLTFLNDNEGGLLHLGVFGSSATTFGANEAADAFITANNQLAINAQNNSGQIRFGIGSTPNTKMLLDSSGRLGIGDLSPDRELVVKNASSNSSIKIEAANDSTSQLFFSDTDAENVARIGVFHGSGQTTSNAMVLETGGSARLMINSSGQVLINKTADRNVYYGGTFSGMLQVEGTGNLSRLTQLIHNQNAQNQHILVIGKSRGSSVSSYTAVQASDYLGTLSFQGADGDAMIEAARIDCLVDGTPGNNDMPGRLSFQTTADGASSTTERIRLDSSGRSLFSGGLGFANIPVSGNAANAAIQIRCNSKYNGIAFGEGAVNGAIGMGGDDTTTAMVFVANANPANLGGGTHDIFEWHAGNSGGGGPGKYMTLDTSGDLTIEDGDLVIGTAGHGIDFSATSDGSGTDSSELLDDYEEGTWTPTQPTVGTTGTTSGHYTKVGDLVMAQMITTVPSNSSGHDVVFDGLPYAAKNGTDGNYIQGGYFTYTNKGSYYSVLVTNNSDRLVVYNTSGGRETLTNWDNKAVRIGITYKIA